ncbi:CDP-diacylglycerol--glycerol-3-phosphate 3-phosphatidyltransferase [Orientia chuto str. Dubai]|uniref:CDP-diacylglycerol--glycerol-3-phosphate 3-phosphatidyltransferase n=1 Tax=Orientia chuto str. Dubai TaxID=1359168 RepID=A0A0F3MIB1_9RICK|nr:CDP-diacylglycerol--glycerol-3-phosphate 3-phosphatidyltransferase [Candidatus Orientia mediorientalis]KJV55508.1 CDP-diacylglycerol--glycerol-3-phosphate 3-phosphatidyltransferase [Orientia chuto str. Dubai]
MLTGKIPNILTAIRIIIIPMIIITFYFDDIIFSRQIAAALFIIAGITDFFDGYIARKFNLHSSFGRMLDHIADKLLVGSIIIMVVKFRKAQELPCLLILCREFLVAGMREFLSQIKVSIPVSRLAKIKTACQISALTILLLGSKGSGITMLDTLGQITLWIAAILTIITGYSYLKACIKYF